MTQEKNDIAKLLSYVRKHEKYIGDRLDKIYNPYETIDLWIKACNIDKGTHAVKAFVLHQEYKRWCNANFYTENQIAKCKSFNAVIKELVNYKMNQRNVIFYINQKVKYEPPKKGQKKEEGGQEANKNTAKKED